MKIALLTRTIGKPTAASKPSKPNPGCRCSGYVPSTAEGGFNYGASGRRKKGPRPRSLRYPRKAQLGWGTLRNGKAMEPMEKCVELSEAGNSPVSGHN